MKSSDIEIMLDGSTMAAFEIFMRQSVLEISGKAMKDSHAVVYDKKENVIRTLIRNMVEGALSTIVKQRRPDTILERHVGRLPANNLLHIHRYTNICRQYIHYHTSSAFVEKLSKKFKKLVSKWHWNISLGNQVWGRFYRDGGGQNH